MMRGILLVLAVALVVGCGDDDSGGGGGSPFKSDAEIEREIAEALDKPPYNEVLHTPLDISCNGISRNLEDGRSTRCSATDSQGNTGAFQVDEVGNGDYEFQPSEVTSALSL